MAEPSPRTAPDPVRTPWFWLGLLLTLALLAAAVWWWLQGREQAPDARAAQLAAAQERGRTLAAELAAAAPPAPADCAPGEVRQPVPGAAAVPASTPAASMPPPPATGKATPLGEAALAQHLENATAMVVVPLDKGVGVGTGFFIAPNLLVTNRHVVEDRQRVFLASNALKTVRRATVLRTTSSADIGSPDFALVRLDEGTAPGLLDATPDIAKLSTVVAAGFPTVVTRSDERFQRLMAGDVSAAPDLSLTQGAVQSLQTGSGGMPVIVHTAAIAKGNSGGPLVDACGRLVGVNTYISVDQAQSARIQYAIRTPVMHAFLQSAGASARNDTRPCTRG